jgi:hypothetical protein
VLTGHQWNPPRKHYLKSKSQTAEKILPLLPISETDRKKKVRSSTLDVFRIHLATIPFFVYLLFVGFYWCFLLFFSHYFLTLSTNVWKTINTVKQEVLYTLDKWVTLQFCDFYITCAMQRAYLEMWKQRPEMWSSHYNFFLAYSRLLG